MEEEKPAAERKDAPAIEPRAAVAAPGLESALNAARASQSYVIAVWHVADGRLNLYRETSGFPPTDLSEAERLLHDDFAAIKSQNDVVV